MTAGELLDRFDSDPDLDGLSDEPEIRALRLKDPTAVLEPADYEPVSELLARLGERIREELARLSEIESELETFEEEAA